MKESTVDPREEFAGRLLDSLIGAMELYTVHLGRELGLYAALRAGELTSADLAKAADVDERYAREWLEQQTAAGLVRVDRADADPQQRRFSVDDKVAEVLLDATSPWYFGTPSAFALGLAQALPSVEAAFRGGSGVAYADFGAQFHGAIAGFNRPMYAHQLGSEWFPTMPDVHRRLSEAPARVLDLGCGQGHSSVAIALAYPQATVRGVDLDPGSIAEARRTAAAAGVADRVSFAVGDGAKLGEGAFDLVTIFEALHDMADPIGTLRGVAELLAPGGSVFVIDDRAEETFTPDAAPVERLVYAFSVLHCLPATRAENGPTAHGTALRPSTLHAWAADAGFATTDLPIENDFFRFYHLTR